MNAVKFVISGLYIRKVMGYNKGAMYKQADIGGEVPPVIF